MELLARTRVVLHHPFFPENVGSVARVMRNCGLTELHVAEGVEPTHEGAFKLAVASGHILETARYHAGLEAALAGATLVLGTTSHPFPHLRVLTPREGAELARSHVGPVALVFGNEKNGLAIGELRRCDAVIRIPSPVKDASLNLAQAAMVVCYEWMLAAEAGGPPDPLAGWRDLAPAEELEAFILHLESLLQERGFYKPHNEDQRRSVLRRIAARLQLDREEVSVLRGLVSKLGQARGPGP
ncbi:MAG: methyltransferase [Cyanobacteria bacterium RYN_339]|nr:methyltransferase [Cyanobacteria bacterium RYN_339]